MLVHALVHALMSFTHIIVRVTYSLRYSIVKETGFRVARRGHDFGKLSK